MMVGTDDIFSFNSCEIFLSRIPEKDVVFIINYKGGIGLELNQLFHEVFSVLKIRFKSISLLDHLLKGFCHVIEGNSNHL